MDLATANATSNNVSILFNNGNGTFDRLTHIDAESQPVAIYGNDLDADGDIDLAVVNFTSNNVVILK